MTNIIPYQQKKRWKFVLPILALIITSGLFWYTNYLVKNISHVEHTRAEIWAQSISKIATTPNIEDDTLADFIYNVRDSLVVPAIITDHANHIIYYRGLNEMKINAASEEKSGKEYDPDYFNQQLEQMKGQHQPIVLRDKKWLVYYKNSSLLTALRIFPYIQLGTITIFLIVGYVVFNSYRRSEQNQIWLGLAKETAHQLGTPISSLMAWVELLKSKFNSEKEPLLLEMSNDIRRLEVVADRFSKIGSQPVLQSYPVYDVVSDFVNYFKARVSDKIKFEVSGDARVEALINIPLFDWVLENLFKNAVDAIDDFGRIEVHILDNTSKEHVIIDVIDTGRGIPRSKFDTVFEPGHTTRKRGWGLGLSLTKRIIDNYHGGHIFVKESELGRGSTFRISLKNHFKKSK